jgi:hypothetical protein
MADNNKLLNLAKGSGKKSLPAKKTGAKKVEKVITPEEQRDLKAKAKVKELLEGVSLTPKKDDLLEVDTQQTGGEEAKSTDWLQEQVGLLSSENELLKTDLLVAKDNYQKLLAENLQLKQGVGIQDESALKTGVLTVFHEIQSNYLKNPGNSQYGTPNFVIVPPAFLNRMIMYFPFLQKEKRF